MIEYETKKNKELTSFVYSYLASDKTPYSLGVSSFQYQPGSDKEKVYVSQFEKMSEMFLRYLKTVPEWSQAPGNPKTWIKNIDKYYRKFLIEAKYSGAGYSPKTWEKFLKTAYKNPNLKYLLLWKSLFNWFDNFNHKNQDWKHLKGELTKIIFRFKGDSYKEEMFNEFYNSNQSAEIKKKDFFPFALVSSNQDYKEDYYKEIQAGFDKYSQKRFNSWVSQNHSTLKETFNNQENLHSDMYQQFKKDIFKESSQYNASFEKWAKQKDNRWLLFKFLNEYNEQAPSIYDFNLQPFNPIDVEYDFELGGLQTSAFAYENIGWEWYFSLKNPTILKTIKDWVDFKEASAVRKFHIWNRDPNVDYETFYANLFKNNPKRLIEIFKTSSDLSRDISLYLRNLFTNRFLISQDDQEKAEVEKFLEKEKWIKVLNDKVNEYVLKNGRQALINLWKKWSIGSYRNVSMEQNYLTDIKNFASSRNYGEYEVFEDEAKTKFTFAFKEIEKEYLKANENKDFTNWEAMKEFKQYVFPFFGFKQIIKPNEPYNVNDEDEYVGDNDKNPYFWQMFIEGESKVFSDNFDKWLEYRNRTLKQYKESFQAFLDYSEAQRASYAKSASFNADLDAWASDQKNGYLAYAKSTQAQSDYDKFFEEKI